MSSSTTELRSNILSIYQTERTLNQNLPVFTTELTGIGNPDTIKLSVLPLSAFVGVIDHLDLLGNQYTENHQIR